MNLSDTSVTSLRMPVELLPK